jgi:adenylate cyclase
VGQRMTVVKPQRRADCTAVRQACQRTVLVCEAKGGEILVSSLLKELTESAGDTAFGEGRQVELKGLAGSHRVYDVGWD